MKATIQNLALAGLVSLGAGFAVSLLPSIDSADLPTQEQGPSALEASSVELAIDGMSVELIEPFVPPGDATETVYDRKLVIEGRGFYGTSRGPWVHLGGVEAFGVEIYPGEESSRITVYLPAGTAGMTEVEVVLPDGRKESGMVGL